MRRLVGLWLVANGVTMDVLDLLILLIECVVVGAGMAIGDWIIKVIAVKLLNNSEQATLHDVEEEPDEDEARRKRARKKPPKPDVAVVP